MNEVTRMKALRLHEFGGAEKLVLVEMDRPEPGPGEVLIKVHASGVNPVDWKTRKGQGVAGRIGGLPAILGWDVSGVIGKAGPGVTRFREGDEVFGMPLFPKAAGGYGEYTVAPADQVALKPASVGHREAAAIPLAALTAWQALVVAAGLKSDKPDKPDKPDKAGHKVLVHGAAGGVGHIAVQIARAMGASVTGTCSQRNLAWVRGLGAEAFDYASQPFEEALRGFDIVLDTVGGDLAKRSLRVLKPGGVVITIAGPGDPEAARALGVRSEFILVHPDGAQLEEIAALMASGVLKPHIEAVRPLAEVAALHALSEGGRVRGKLVLDVAGGGRMP